MIIIMHRGEFQLWSTCNRVPLQQEMRAARCYLTPRAIAIWAQWIECEMRNRWLACQWTTIVVNSNLSQLQDQQSSQTKMHRCIRSSKTVERMSTCKLAECQAKNESIWTQTNWADPKAICNLLVSSGTTWALRESQCDLLTTNTAKCNHHLCKELQWALLAETMASDRPMETKALIRLEVTSFPIKVSP